MARTDVDSYSLDDRLSPRRGVACRFIRISADATAGNSTAQTPPPATAAQDPAQRQTRSGRRQAAADRGAKYAQRAHAVACGIAVDGRGADPGAAANQQLQRADHDQRGLACVVRQGRRNARSAPRPRSARSPLRGPRARSARAGRRQRLDPAVRAKLVRVPRASEAVRGSRQRERLRLPQHRAAATAATGAADAGTPPATASTTSTSTTTTTTTSAPPEPRPDPEPAAEPAVGRGHPPARRSHRGDPRRTGDSAERRNRRCRRRRVHPKPPAVRRRRRSPIRM